MENGEIKGCSKSLQYITRFAVVCLVLLGALSIPTAWYFVGWYTDNPDVLNYATKLIQLNALATPIWAFSFVLPVALKVQEMESIL